MVMLQSGVEIDYMGDMTPSALTAGSLAPVTGGAARIIFGLAAFPAMGAGTAA